MDRSDLDAWLDAMPVVSAEELDRRERALTDLLDETNRKLAVIRLLRGGHPVRTRPDTPQSSSPSMTRIRQHNAHARKLSPEREAIVRLIEQHPAGLSPSVVWRRLTAAGMEVSSNAIQTTMSRMAHAGQLLRVEAGLYRLPTQTPAADLLSASTANGNGNGAHAEEAMP